MPFCAEQAKKKAMRDSNKSGGKLSFNSIKEIKNKISCSETNGANFLQTAKAKIDIAFIPERQNGAIKWLRTFGRIFSDSEDFHARSFTIRIRDEQI
jgi:hypothetical protein